MQNNGVEAQLSYDVIRGTNVQLDDERELVDEQEQAGQSVQRDAFQRPGPDVSARSGRHGRADSAVHAPRSALASRSATSTAGSRSTSTTRASGSSGQGLGRRFRFDPQREADDRCPRQRSPKQYAAWNNNVQVRNFDLERKPARRVPVPDPELLRMYYENPKMHAVQHAEAARRSTTCTASVRSTTTSRT